MSAKLPDIRLTYGLPVAPGFKPRATGFSVQILKYPLSIATQFIGLTAYEQALNLMEETIRSTGSESGHIWGLEHPLVYTSGLKTEAAHILDPRIPVLPARRGGSVTLHNPGQLVVYFVLPLSAINGGLERFVRVLEAVIAETLISFGINANLLPGASGVFTPVGKIGFIGLGLKKGFIYHGISINVANELANFRAIQSCGLSLPITSMQTFLRSHTPATDKVFDCFISNLLARFQNLTPTDFRRAAEKRLDLTDWFTGFRLGWLAFHERRYWEAHELWELYWHKLSAAKLRIFFHALIQTAMACYKLFTAPNPAGAESLLRKALEKYAITKEIQLLQEQKKLIEYLVTVLAALENNKPLEELLLPPVLAWVAAKPGRTDD